MKARNFSRRHFLTMAAATSLTGKAMAADQPPRTPLHFCAFTKGFEHVSYREMAKLIANAGFQGIEGTVRTGGQVTPENVEEELPQLVEALNEKGLALTIMASGVNGVNSLNEKVLRTAVALGIKRYRLAHYRYDLKKPIPPQLTEFGAQLKEVDAMNQDLGIQGLYQNHSGANYFGTAVWDLYELIKELPQKSTAAAFDIGHATVEGGTNWPLQANLIRPFAGALFVKDFYWKAPGKRGKCPLGEGIVDGKKLKELWFAKSFDHPISLHVEYHDHKDPSAVPAMAKSLQRDLRVLKGWL